MRFTLMRNDGEGGDEIEMAVIECDVAPPVGTIIYIEHEQDGGSDHFVVEHHYWFIPRPYSAYRPVPKCYIYLTPITEESVNIPT